MLTEICQFLRNWFVRDTLLGEFKIEGGVLTYEDGTALPLLSNQYFRIVGSILNDGVYKNDGETDLEDEEFSGAVWAMAVPPDFISLVEEISKWCADNATAINSPYQSESFGGYSYSKGYAASGSGGTTGITWQTQFASRLGPWRKI